MLASGETPSDDRGCGQVSPEIGITATPVIDRARNAIYIVAMSKTSGGSYFHRIHALNLTTGAELFGGPKVVSATFPGAGANSTNGKPYAAFICLAVAFTPSPRLVRTSRGHGQFCLRARLEHTGIHPVT